MAQQGNHQAEQLKAFWQSQLVEVAEVPPDPAVFKNHQLPLARIKKIMKSDEDVRMISAEAPVLFAKACEMFILELTLRSWMHAEENKRRTLQRNDVAAAITKTEIFDFLLDIVPRDDSKPEEVGPGAAATSSAPPIAPAAAMTAGQAVPAAPRPPGAMAHPALGPGSLYFPAPYSLPPGALSGDPSQAATAAAAAAAMMRPPMPTMGVDPALVSLYQQQLLSAQGWPHIPGLPPPPTVQGAAAAAAAAVAAQAQQQAAAAAAAAAAAGAAQAAATACAQQQGQGQGQPGATAAAGTPTSGQTGQQGAAQSEKKS
ncbi:hypothetical protein PLESTM_000227500 [Pleodorina starrii]|nr:hypothetical protein PLESTM_000227500 [Pleodorina starrii]